MLLAVMPACSLYLMASQEETEPLPWTPRLLVSSIKKKKEDKPFKIMVPQGTIANSQEYCRIFGYFDFLKEVQLYWVSIYWIPHELLHEIAHSFNSRPHYMDFIGRGLWRKLDTLKVKVWKALIKDSFAAYFGKLYLLIQPISIKLPMMLQELF